MFFAFLVYSFVYNPDFAPLDATTLLDAIQYTMMTGKITIKYQKHQEILSLFKNDSELKQFLIHFCLVP